MPDATASQPHHIVVVGGGAAGLELVTRLGNTLGKSGRARITLVERRRTHLWKPLLHAVAAGSLDRAQHELNYLAQAHWHHFTYRFGEMAGLDRDRREIRMAATFDEEGREITPEGTLQYDTLIVSVGSVTNDFGTPGAAKFAIPLETAEQATRFNRRLVNACLRANAQAEPVRPGQLHVAIIGAGATGTELSAELHRTVRAVVAYGLDHIEPERDIRIVLVEAAPRILPALPERISAATLGLLAKLGVDVAHRRAGQRGARRWRVPGRWRFHSRRACGVVSRREGAGFPARDRRTGDQPYQPAGGGADAADHARPQHLRDRRLRLLPTPPVSTSRFRRAPRRPTNRPATWSARSRAGWRASPWSRSSIAISARWCRWGSIPRWAA